MNAAMVSDKTAPARNPGSPGCRRRQAMCFEPFVVDVVVGGAGVASWMCMEVVGRLRSSNRTSGARRRSCSCWCFPLGASSRLPLGS